MHRYLYTRKYYFFVFVAPFLVLFFQAVLLFPQKRNRFLLPLVHCQVLPPKLLFYIFLVDFQYNNLFLFLYIEPAVAADTDCISV